MKHITKISLVLLSVALLGAACSKKGTNTNTPGTTIHTGAANAFGSLASATQAPQTTLLNERSGVADTAGGAPVADLKIAAPNILYKYVFAGTPPTIAETTVNVFARNVGTTLAMPADLKSIAGLGGTRFGDNPTLDNLSIRNGNEQWYVDALTGSISMYLNDTTTGVAVPTDGSTNTNANIDVSGAIGIATAFLAEHTISTTAYGQPLSTLTATSYPGAEVKALDTQSSATARPAYSATMAQVIYPLLMNGVAVVQSNGESFGLTVSVDMTNKRVTSMYGLNSLEFTQSAYDAVTDFSTIKKIAEQGGIYGSMTTDSQAKTVNLDTPDRVLMQTYLYTDNHSRELYVPALRFPLVNPPDTYTKYVIVPLAKDLIVTNPIGVIEPGATTGSGSSAILPQ